MSESQLRAVIEQHITKSQWYDDHEYKANRRRALDSYYLRDKPQSSDGCSDAHSSDVADMIEATVSQILPAFDFETVCKFKPVNAGDVEQAKLETAVCNAELRQLNAGHTTLQEAIRNALLLRNGIVKCYTRRTVTVDRQRFQDLGPLELAAVRQPTAPGQVVDVQNPKRNGRNVDVTIKRTTTTRQLAIEAIDPSHFLVTKDHKGIDTQDARCVGDHFYLTRSQLMQRGHSKKKVYDLPTDTLDTESGEAHRSRDSNPPEYESNGDPSQMSVECFELWVYVDFDGDGIAERRRVLYCGGTNGGTVLENEVNAVSPYACGTAFLQPHRFMGVSLFDKVEEVEKEKTEVLRQYIDNLKYANNHEVLINDGLVNEADLKARRPGGINRADDINGLRELDFASNGEESILLLNYLDKVRSERAGSQLQLQTDPALNNATAHGLERQYGSKEQLPQLMTRTLGETLVRQLFLLIHETLRRDFPEPRVAETGNGFVAADPASWQPRAGLELVAGMSYAERQERRLAYEMTLGQQEKLLQAGMGGILVDLQTYHATLVDWLQASGVASAARYFIDPRTPDSIQAQQRDQAAKQQQQQAEQELQRVLVTSERATSQLAELNKALQFDQNLTKEYWSESLNAAIELLKSTTEAAPEAADNVVALQQARGVARSSESE